jgi:signal transduction histidine kinase
VILTFSDETELRSRKHLLAEIKRLTDALQAAGSICHELAQPLMTISGYVQLLLMDTEKGSTRYARLEKINDQALRISAITREVMNIRQRHLAADGQSPSTATGHRHLTLI